VEEANAKLFTFGSYCLGVISGISLHVVLFCSTGHEHRREIGFESSHCLCPKMRAVAKSASPSVLHYCQSGLITQLSNHHTSRTTRATMSYEHMVDGTGCD
jgi:hypothetical protein